MPIVDSIRKTAAEFKKKTQDVLHEGSQELGQASLRQKVVLGATALGLVFEWGTGNEALIGFTGGNVLRATHDILLTALAGGGASFAEQSVLGAVTAVSVHNFPKVMKAVRNNFFGSDTKAQPAQSEMPNDTDTTNLLASEEPQRRNPLARSYDRFITAFTFGTSLTTIKNNSVEERSLGRNTKDAVIDAALIGGGVTGVAAAIAGLADVGIAFGGGWETTADIGVDILSNPATYLALFGINVLSKHVARRKRDRLTAAKAPTLPEN